MNDECAHPQIFRIGFGGTELCGKCKQFIHKQPGGQSVATPETINITLSETAKEAVRLAFNPSGIDAVQKIKLLAAAMITEVEQITLEGLNEDEAHTARIAIQTASMWAVATATKLAK